jgi:RNA polymerase sigma factor (sigma-70 family)
VACARFYFHAPAHRRFLEVARRQTGDEEGARDAAQNVFALMAQKAASLRGHPSLAGWLFVTCRMECRAWLRREQRRARLMKNYAAHAESRKTGAPVPHIPPAALDDAMEKLSPAERGLLFSRYYEDASFADLAGARGVSEEAVRKQVSRALHRLGSLLGARGAAVAGTLLAPALAQGYQRHEAPGAAALAHAALQSAPVTAAAFLPAFMTAKTTTITAAALACSPEEQFRAVL